MRLHPVLHVVPSFGGSTLVGENLLRNRDFKDGFEPILAIKIGTELLHITKVIEGVIPKVRKIDNEE